MRKIYLLSALLLSTFLSTAQHINSIQVIPSNPTTADTIYVIADMWFTSGSCDQHTQQSLVNGNYIDCYTLHCSGPLTVICNDADTFKINPLPSGNYTVRLQVDAGALPSPCTPGIVAGETDSIAISVSPAVGINDNNGLSSVLISYANNLLHLTNFAFKEDLFITVSDVKGKIIFEKMRFKNDLKLPFNKSNGIYFVKIENKSGKSETRKIVVED